MKPALSSAESFGTHPDADGCALIHPGRMGKRPARIKVVVREVLLRILEERQLSRQEMAAHLGIHRKTLDGILRENDPRPASQDVQNAIRSAYGVELHAQSPPVVGVLGAGGRATFNTRPAMPSDVVLETAVVELDLEPGDWLRIEPHTGPMVPGRWYLVSFANVQDALVQAGELNGIAVFREADAPADDLRAFVEGVHRVEYEATAYIKPLRTRAGSRDRRR